MSLEGKSFLFCLVSIPLLIFSYITLKPKVTRTTLPFVHYVNNTGPLQHNVNNTTRKGISTKEEERKRLPQCIIVGVRKAGTKALITFLTLHPDVVAPSDEPHFFDLGRKYARGLDYYRNLMPESTPSQITIEKTPAYFFSPNHTLTRIKAMNESIKIIVIVREPVERAVSEYVMFDYHKNKLREPFEDFAFNQDGSVREDYFRLVNSKYYLNAKRWLQFFSRDKMHFVNGDVLIRDPLPELTKIETFLGLSHKITRKNLYYSEQKGFYCFKEKNKSMECLEKGKGRPHPEISPKHQRILNDYFRPFNRKFFELIGQDFGWPT